MQLVLYHYLDKQLVLGFPQMATQFLWILLTGHRHFHLAYSCRFEKTSTRVQIDEPVKVHEWPVALDRACCIKRIE